MIKDLMIRLAPTVASGYNLDVDSYTEVSVHLAHIARAAEALERSCYCASSHCAHCIASGNLGGYQCSDSFRCRHRFVLKPHHLVLSAAALLDKLIAEVIVSAVRNSGFKFDMAHDA